MHKNEYLMESSEETQRLEAKTDRAALRTQALWAGIRPGMRVADIGCGSGITSSLLQELVQPDGEVVGIDTSKERIAHAGKCYANGSIEFLHRDIRLPLDDLGRFDFVWVRFVLEYFRSSGASIVENLSRVVKPGGVLCLIDLDHNCLNHYGMSLRLEQTLFAIMEVLREKADFDPYMGRKLYSFLYDLGFHDIEVDVSAHHLIYGPLSGTDSFNWLKKVETAPRKVGYSFPEYEGGYD
jgi:ubiquinone/menaquinone biosynthesis C-methylase UbiE